MAGKLIIFSAPSGAGKSTIVRHLLKEFPKLEFSVSACSRAPRGQEVDGVDYHFLSVDEFKNKIEKEEFAEWEEVYTNNYYGTLHAEMNRIWDKGHVIAFDIDVLGGINLKKQFGDNAMSLFVMPPSIEVLKERLKARGTEDEASIERRIGKAQEEIDRANLFDEIILNDKLEEALLEAERLVKEFVQS